MDLSFVVSNGQKFMDWRRWAYLRVAVVFFSVFRTECKRFVRTRTVVTAASHDIEGAK
jgi:hypothetical protein